LTINTANETYVPHVILHHSLIVSESGKCVNDDTENDIEEQNDDDKEEGQIIQCAQKVNLLRVIVPSVRGQEVTYTTSCTKTEVQS
jgi:hypothetical protein